MSNTQCKHGRQPNTEMHVQATHSPKQTVKAKQAPSSTKQPEFNPCKPQHTSPDTPKRSPTKPNSDASNTHLTNHEGTNQSKPQQAPTNSNTLNPPPPAKKRLTRPTCSLCFPKAPRPNAGSRRSRAPPPKQRRCGSWRQHSARSGPPPKMRPSLAQMAVGQKTGTKMEPG